MIANWAETVPQFVTPSRENMPEYGARIRKNRKTRIVRIAASSGRIGLSDSRHLTHAIVGHDRRGAFLIGTVRVLPDRFLKDPTTVRQALLRLRRRSAF